MKTRPSIIKRHSILLEYTILICSIVPLVFGASALVYTHSRDGGSWGAIGKSVVGLYQRIITVISLPIP